MDLMTLAMAKALGGGSGGGSVEEKTLAQRGFMYKNAIRKSGNTYEISVSDSELPNGVSVENFVPETGSILCAKFSSGLSGNVSIYFGNNAKQSRYFSITIRDAVVSSDYIKENNAIVILQFYTNKYNVVGVVRDPANVPTKLSDLNNDLALSDFENDLDISAEGINIIDMSGSAQNFMGLIAVVKSGISGNSGEKTVFFQANRAFSSLVGLVFDSFLDEKMPVISLGDSAYFPVLDTGADGSTGNAWFTMPVHESEMSGTNLIGYAHEICIAHAGIIIHTQKYEIDIQTLPSGD